MNSGSQPNASSRPRRKASRSISQAPLGAGPAHTCRHRLVTAPGRIQLSCPHGHGHGARSLPALEGLDTTRHL